MLPVSIALLGGLLTQAILYGVYLITIGLVFKSFSSRSARFRRIVDTVLCSVTFIIALSVTFDFALNIHRMVDVLNSGANVSTIGECDAGCLLKASSILVVSALADAVLIWRCWILYAKSWRVIIFPSILWVATLVFTPVTPYVARGGSNTFNKYVVLVIPYWTCTLVLNLTCTGLITYRFLRHKREVALITSLGNGKQTLSMRLMVIIMESGVLYAVTTIPVLISQILKNESLFITTGMSLGLTAIAFNLIIIRSSVLVNKPMNPSVETPVYSVHISPSEEESMNSPRNESVTTCELGVC